MTQVVINAAAVKAYGRSPSVLEFLQSLGDSVAADAAEAAPKLTGSGAASIHAVVDTDDKGALVRISWTPEHFYLKFSELGDSRQPARPFLRPALERQRVL